VISEAGHYALPRESYLVSRLRYVYSSSKSFSDVKEKINVYGTIASLCHGASYYCTFDINIWSFKVIRKINFNVLTVK